MCNDNENEAFGFIHFKQVSFWIDTQKFFKDT